MDPERSPAPAPIHIALRPAVVLATQGAVIACLVSASLAGQVSKYFLGHDVVFGMVNLFNVDGEGNVPTWYQASALLACAVLLAVIGVGARAAKQPFAYQWLGLAAVFVYLSGDEASFIHELTNPVFRGPNTPTVLYYSWVVLGGAFVVTIAALYARFLLGLPRNVAKLMVVAGTVYVAGALVTELAGAWIAVKHGVDTFAYVIQFTVEETLEMTGVALFTYTLLRHIGDTAGAVQLVVTGRQVEADREAAGGARA